jgi:hypothetical protein
MKIVTLKTVIPAQAGTQCMHAPPDGARKSDPRLRGDEGSGADAAIFGVTR